MLEWHKEKKIYFKFLILIFSLFFLIGNVSALSVNIPIPTNYSTINVSDAQTLQGLTPTQVANLFTSPFLINQSFPFHTWVSNFLYDYNQTLPAMNYCSSQIIANNTANNNKFLNLSGTNANQNINVTPYNFSASNIKAKDNLFSGNLTENRLVFSDSSHKLVDSPAYFTDIDENFQYLGVQSTAEDSAKPASYIFGDWDGFTNFAGFAFQPMGFADVSERFGSEVESDGTYTLASLYALSIGTTEIDFSADIIGIIGDLWIKDDNNKLEWGAGDGTQGNANCYYNASDFICNPKNIGSGKFYVQGSEVIKDNLVVGGNLSVKRAHFYGYDNSTQPNAGTTVTNVMNLTNNADYLAYGINVSKRQNLTFTSTGVYICDVSPEFINTDSTADIGFWMRKNGVDVAWSNSRYSLANNAYYAPNIPFAFEIRTPATDYVNFVWWSSNANTVLYSSGALSSPTRSSVPAVIINCRKSSEIT